MEQKNVFTEKSVAQHKTERRYSLFMDVNLIYWIGHLDDCIQIANETTIFTHSTMAMKEIEHTQNALHIWKFSALM